MVENSFSLKIVLYSMSSFSSVEAKQEFYSIFEGRGEIT